MDNHDKETLRVLMYLKLIDLETEVHNYNVEQSIEAEDGEYDGGDLEDYSFYIDDHEYFVEEQSMVERDWVTYPTKKVYHIRGKNNHQYDYKITFEVNGHDDELYKDTSKGEIYSHKRIDIDAILKKHMDNE